VLLLSSSLSQSGCMFTTLSRVNLCRFFPSFFPEMFQNSDARAQRPAKAFFRRNHLKELRFLRYIYYVYLLHTERPYLFLAAYVNVIIIIIVVIPNVRKKDININTYESSETFRRVDRTATDFNRLGDFSRRGSAHGDRVFSDRDKCEHGRYVYYIYESVCFF